MGSDLLRLKHLIVRRAMACLTPISIAGFRRLEGRLCDRITLAAPITLLTTRRRRTGLERTVAVDHMRDGDDVIVYGSYGGMPREPAWTLNLRAHPWARVELGKETFEAEPEFLTGAERDRLWDELVAAYPIYGRLPAWAEREIPVIRLRPLPTDVDRAPDSPVASRLWLGDVTVSGVDRHRLPERELIFEASSRDPSVELGHRR